VKITSASSLIGKDDSWKLNTRITSRRGSTQKEVCQKGLHPLRGKGKNRHDELAGEKTKETIQRGVHEKSSLQQLKCRLGQLLKGGDEGRGGEVQDGGTKEERKTSRRSARQARGLSSKRGRGRGKKEKIRLRKTT